MSQPSSGKTASVIYSLLKPGLVLKPGSEEAIAEVREIARALSILKKKNPLYFFKPLPKQSLFEKCLAKIKILFGGNRSGKSEEGAFYVIQKCLAKPKQRWWAVAETEEVSVNVQQRKIWELLPKDKVRYAYYDEINGFRNGKVVFSNGSMIRFKTYKQGREAFASDDLDGIWNDEEPPFEIYKEQKMRLLDRDGEMIFTMTSLKGITELMQELFEDHDIIEAEYSPLVEETLPRIVEKNGVRSFMLWTTENPHISQDRLKEDMKVMTRQEIKNRILGIPMNLSGRIYPSYNKKIHKIPMANIPTKQVCIWHVLDPHDRKPWFATWWVVDKMGHAYCAREYPWRRNFNEIEFDDKSIEDYANLFKKIELELIETYGRPVSKRIIDPNFGNSTVQKAQRTADGQAKTTLIKELKKCGLNYQDGIDLLETGHIQVRKQLHYEEKNGVLIVHPNFYIGEDCENMDRHMSRYSRKDIETADGDIKDKVGPQEKYKDGADNARYFWMANPHYIERVFQGPPEPVRKVY